MDFKFFRFSIYAFILCFIVSCTAEEDIAKTEIAESQPIVLDYEYSALELETINLINDYRNSIGLNSLEIINHLSHKSEQHDNYMIANNVVNHNDFEARSSNIMKAFGAKNVTENIAYNFNSAKGAFDAWIKSEGHRQNIEGDFTHFGISIRENPINGRKYYTNIFAKI